MVSGSLSLFSSKFFSPFPHGTSSLSVSDKYLALPDGPGQFKQDFTCPVLLRILLCQYYISYTGLSPSMDIYSKIFYYIIINQSYSPITPLQQIIVWAFLVSLAATYRITFVFFSSGYLDVSVLQVSLKMMLNFHIQRVPSFGNLWIIFFSLITTTYRSLSRPSSSFRAKASTIRSYLLLKFKFYSLSSLLSLILNFFAPSLSITFFLNFFFSGEYRI